jgi:uncharacterized protein YdiU (UPF0061 family)
VLTDFEAVMEDETTRRALERLGLAAGGAADRALVAALYDFLEASHIGYERCFFDLYGGLAREQRAMSGPAKGHYDGPKWQDLRAILELYQPARDTVPAYFEADGPCTLLIDEIEAIWTLIAEKDDWAPFHEKIRQIREMGAAYARSPRARLMVPGP